MSTGAPQRGGTGAPDIPPSVSVCFPAYNEEGTIAGVLTEAHDLLVSSGLDYEILVCNDGSTDRTGAIVDEIGARLPRMRVLHHAHNLGIRETFEHLYRNAIKEFVFLNSTDRQWHTRVLFEHYFANQFIVTDFARRRDEEGQEHAYYVLTFQHA